MEQLKPIIEALVFASDTPVSLQKMSDILEGVDRKEIATAVYELMKEYDDRRSGLCLVEVAGGYQFRTRDDFSSWVRKLRGMRPISLSRAALETLAVIAYKQPIMKAEVEKVRGVDVSGTLRGLLEKNLVRIVGRKDVPGRPIIYGTTKKFLEVFNLNDLTELPTLSELKELGE